MDALAARSQIRSLLIVDDSAVQREHAAGLCRSLGVHVIHEAASGAEAIALLGRLAQRPELLIIDLEMPGMDGVELIQQLHQRDIIVPVIVASGREITLIQSVERMARNLGMPVLGGMKKPLSTALMGDALQRVGQTSDIAKEAAQPGPSFDRTMLARAIAAGEIGPHYQPKVDMRTGIVRGVEALARWQLPGGGFVRPDDFVALAEREGLIEALTQSIATQALSQAAAWNAHGLQLSTAINLAPCLLARPSLVEDLLGLTVRFGLLATQVVLEITESSLVDCSGAALGVLARLRIKGFGLSIDDYGTGFSSMQQLARIPFTELKVDRSFVHGAHQREDMRVILQSALEMARRLDLVSVAEGVETMADWRLLQQCGCSIGQGYLIAKPMRAADIPPWLKRHNSRLRELQHQPPLAH
jgi:EAL domain-containing protein (putative c-di-GMP-specific phosphodiesterase class I)/FixJ family two-component response regulator